MSFDSAFARTIGIEGGYSNNPADPGGETMWGITATVARAHGYLGPMADMSIEAARDIYRQSYWNLLHLPDLDTISPAVAQEMFDIAVNRGASVPVPYLQRALNAFNRRGQDYADVPVDGLAGAMTIAALRAFMHLRGALGEKVMISALLAQLGEGYLDIVEKRPLSEDFIFGWFAKRIVVAA